MTAAKLGNILADANLVSWTQNRVFESSQKYFCFTDAKFPSETNVS